MVANHYRDKREINLFSRNDRNYKSDTRDDMNLDQANNKYLL